MHTLESIPLVRLELLARRDVSSPEAATLLPKRHGAPRVIRRW
jgi:hypothetical protein